MSNAVQTIDPVVETLEKDYQDVMAGLQAFSKAVAEIKPENMLKSVDGDGGEKPKDKKPAVDPEDGPEKSDGKPMGKAVDTDHALLDGEEVIQDFKQTLHKSIASVQASLGASNLKALEGVSMLCKAIEVQGRMIKALTEDVATLGNQGKVRKSVLTVHDRGTNPAGTQPVTDSCTRDEFMAKAVDANLGGANVSMIRQYLNALPDRPIADAVPAHLYQAVMKERK